MLQTLIPLLVNFKIGMFGKLGKNKKHFIFYDCSFVTPIRSASSALPTLMSNKGLKAPQIPSLLD